MTLYLFVAAYPYGDTTENFLEVELPFLLEKFPNICLVPLGSHNLSMRPLPNGCVVDNSLRNSRTKKIIIGLINVWRVLPLYLKDLLCGRHFLSISDIKKFFISCIIAAYYMQSKIVKSITKHASKDDLIYYYWGADYNAIAPFLKGKVRQVSRFHGDWDLWIADGKEEGYKPCREELMSSLDLAITISNKGADFLKKRYKTNNIITSHLGTLDKGICQKSTDGKIRVLSCSTVYPLKRVDLIFESVKELAMTGRDVLWTHIGGGTDFNKLSSLVHSQKINNLSINLLGEIPLDAVYNYYKTHKVDVFVNLSTNEGIPVSIMEAISFNIPAIATNVGGNAEIVTEASGILVDEAPLPRDVANAIIRVISNPEIMPRKFWEQNFSADKNYTSFAELLYNLRASL